MPISVLRQVRLLPLFLSVSAFSFSPWASSLFKVLHCLQILRSDYFCVFLCITDASWISRPTSILCWWPNCWLSVHGDGCLQKCNRWWWRCRMASRRRDYIIIIVLFVDMIIQTAIWLVMFPVILLQEIRAYLRWNSPNACRAIRSSYLIGSKLPSWVSSLLPKGHSEEGKLMCRRHGLGGKGVDHFRLSVCDYYEWLLHQVQVFVCFRIQVCKSWPCRDKSE